MAKFLCHIENEETGYVTDTEEIEAADEAEAEEEYYIANPCIGFEGDVCIVEAVK